MPLQKALERARKDEREGKSASTQAGEFVREEIDNVRAGKSGARSVKQAIAIGLSEARRAGVDLPPPRKGAASPATRVKARKDLEAGKEKPAAKPSPKRSAATRKALEREGNAAITGQALSRQARSAAAKRTPAQRSAAARKAAATKGPEGRSQAAKKAARTRARGKD
ncbi:DUF6496 domain-containing protein [Stenotrophomonas sp. MMGLT7]|uniref:DUF6496 domain-containing protein n=1 Tax=Stenotrophomonas sp. MMGLT7 TaxID=2901227 RepID=UPI001E5F0AAB|nr:DUF6496 domain-containing protein [Stenotrophomonas sp. MMGLT7]MCD7097795.1 DUF6496 domain-containing protein [Stenotrophomonas sp. MMGLT7]